MDFVIGFSTGHSKMDFNTSDLKNLRQYDYCKNQSENFWDWKCDLRLNGHHKTEKGKEN